MGDALRRNPIVATVNLTPIGSDMMPAEPATTVALNHQANIEVCEAVQRMFERQQPISPVGVAL